MLTQKVLWNPVSQIYCPAQLMPETLYLTVNLIDRFLEAKQVTRKHLQLVRTAWHCVGGGWWREGRDSGPQGVGCQGAGMFSEHARCRHGWHTAVSVYQCAMAVSLQNPSHRLDPQVGVTAMLIASKYEEIWAPEVRDFVYISDRAYSREQILQMEKVMLNTLRFNLTVPTAHQFLSRYLKIVDAASDT